MRTIKAWGPLVALLLVLLIGRRLSIPDPSAKVYWNWLMWSGVALGMINGIWGGNIAKVTRSRFGAVLAGAAAACGVALFEVVLYGLALPDALHLPPGQVPQDNFAAWLLGGIGLVPASVISGGASGFWHWRVNQNQLAQPSTLH